MNHHSLLLDIIASELGVDRDAVHDFELCLFDTQVWLCCGVCVCVCVCARVRVSCAAWCIRARVPMLLRR